MTTEEKNACKQECERELCDKFVLVPKNKLYYIIGGALAVIVIATGLSLASVFAYLRSEPAEIARKRIEQIRSEAEVILTRLKDEGSYVRYGSKIALQSGADTHRFLHNHTTQAGVDTYQGTLVHGKQVPITEAGAQWTIIQVPAK
jgi:hypothetical protein